MIPQLLFWAGVTLSVITGSQSWLNHGDDKKGAVAFPFMLLAAAAVAKYIGF